MSASYRTGDLTHAELGDIEVECPECHGFGFVMMDGIHPRIWYRHDCENCHGSGTVWSITDGDEPEIREAAE